MNTNTTTTAAQATATMSTVACCNRMTSPLVGTQHWTCATCGTKWDIRDFDRIPFGQTRQLKAV